MSALASFQYTTTRIYAIESILLTSQPPRQALVWLERLITVMIERALFLDVYASQVLALSVTQ